MKTWFRLTLLLLVLSVVPTFAEAQGAACTGWCYVSGNMPYCGFTALQEGGSCSVSWDFWHGWTCTIRTCSSGPGNWDPENQGWLAPFAEPAVTERRAQQHEVRVTLLEPRT